MNYDFNRQWLAQKFEEIKKRMLNAIEQLNEEELNWFDNEYSNNIPTLLKHMEGNIKERVRKGICKEEITRDRDNEFSKTYMSKTEAITLVQTNFQYVIELVSHISDEVLEEVQRVRGKERTNLDMLHQCAAHYSEHMGQILYITKNCLKDKYKTTSL